MPRVVCDMCGNRTIPTARHIMLAERAWYAYGSAMIDTATVPISKGTQEPEPRHHLIIDPTRRAPVSRGPSVTVVDATSPKWPPSLEAHSSQHGRFLLNGAHVRTAISNRKSRTARVIRATAVERLKETGARGTLCDAQRNGYDVGN